MEGEKNLMNKSIDVNKLKILMNINAPVCLIFIVIVVGEDGRNL